MGSKEGIFFLMSSISVSLYANATKPVRGKNWKWKRGGKNCSSDALESAGGVGN